jgi:hypothetical protein
VSTINANTSVLEYEHLTAGRAQARLARKATNRARYLRRYARVGLHEIERMVPCPVLVTIELHVLS